MSNFTGATFARQKVSPSDDAIIRRAILPDGVLTGCTISYSGSTLTMAAGQLMVCGRQIRHPSAQNWAVTGATSGFARLVLTIDLTRTATKETFDQVVDSIEYASAEDGFVELEQSDINISGSRYQIAVCVVSLGTGGITGIISQLEKSAVDGSGALNFKVVGGLTQPSDPKENTIWVQTETRIPSWIFSASEPAEAAEGTLWIATGKTSALAFNALKKNTLMVYPLNAKQYISGQWVRVEAWIYMNGVWTSLFSGLFYESGVFYTEHTNYLVPDTAVIEENAASIDLSTVAKKTSEVYKVFGPVPLDDISTLAMTSAFTDSVSGVHRRVLYAAKSPDAGYADAEAIEAVAVSSSWTTETTITLDVSGLSGEYYVYAGTNTAGSAWDNVRKLSITKVTGEDSAAMAAKAAAYDILTEGVTE